MFQNIVLKIIKFYQIFISPLLGENCRFYPSCSEYAYRAVEKYGFLNGSWRGLKRLLKCHRFNPGGVDLP